MHKQYFLLLILIIGFNSVFSQNYFTTSIRYYPGAPVSTIQAGDYTVTMKAEGYLAMYKAGVADPVWRFPAAGSSVQPIPGGYFSIEWDHATDQPFVGIRSSDPNSSQYIALWPTPTTGNTTGVHVTFMFLTNTGVLYLATNIVTNGGIIIIPTTDQAPPPPPVFFEADIAYPQDFAITNGAYKAVVTNDGHLAVYQNSNLIGQYPSTNLPLPLLPNTSYFKIANNYNSATQENWVAMGLGGYLTNLSPIWNPIFSQDNVKASRMALTNNGTLILYSTEVNSNGDPIPLWNSYTGSITAPCSTFPLVNTGTDNNPNGTNTLKPNKRLYSGEKLVSSNGKYELQVGGDVTKLVRVDGGATLLSTPPYSSSSGQAFMAFDDMRWVTAPINNLGPETITYGYNFVAASPTQTAVPYAAITNLPTYPLPWVRIMTHNLSPAYGSNYDEWDYAAGFGDTLYNFLRDTKINVANFCYPSVYDRLIAGRPFNPLSDTSRASIIPYPYFDPTLMNAIAVNIPNVFYGTVYTTPGIEKPYGGLVLLDDGNLVMLNSLGQIIWQSGTSEAQVANTLINLELSNISTEYVGGTIIQARQGHISLFNTILTQRQDPLFLIARDYVLLTPGTQLIISGTGTTSLQVAKPTTP